MIYQLPNGKIVHISTEQYLDMTDQDIQDLMAGNVGEYPESHWQESAIRKPKKKTEVTHDKSIDYQEESEEIPMQVTTTIAIITVDDVGITEESEELQESEEQD
jgi:hypothetical protein